MERLEIPYFERFMKRFGRDQDAVLKLASYDVFESRARLEFNAFDNSSRIWVVLVLEFKGVKDFVIRELAPFSVQVVENINLAQFEGITFVDFQPFKEVSEEGNFLFSKDDFYCSDGMCSAASVCFETSPVIASPAKT